jgi:hypothetical protein
MRSDGKFGSLSRSKTTDRRVGTGASPEENYLQETSDFTCVGNNSRGKQGDKFSGKENKNEK